MTNHNANRLPPNERHIRPGYVYCAMICATLIIMTLIGTFGH